MKKFTEGVVPYNKSQLIEMGEDFAEDVILKMDSYLSIETLPGEENLVRVSTNESNGLYREKCQLFYTFEFTKTKHLFKGRVEGGIEVEDFTKFTEFINRLDEFLKQLSIFSTQHIVRIGEGGTQSEKIFVHLGKSTVTPEDYYEIFKTRIDYMMSSNGYATNNSEFKKVRGGWVLELDIAGDLIFIDSLSDKGLVSYFKPNSNENPVAYEQYMEEPITKDIWDSWGDNERQEAWVDRFRAFTYWDLGYDWVKTITPNKLQLIDPVDDGLEEYKPNNI